MQYVRTQECVSVLKIGVRRTVPYMLGHVTQFVSMGVLDQVQEIASNVCQTRSHLTTLVNVKLIGDQAIARFTQALVHQSAPDVQDRKLINATSVYLMQIVMKLPEFASVKPDGPVLPVNKETNVIPYARWAVRGPAKQSATCVFQMLIEIWKVLVSVMMTGQVPIVHVMTGHVMATVTYVSDRPTLTVSLAGSTPTRTLRMVDATAPKIG